MTLAAASEKNNPTLSVKLERGSAEAGRVGPIQPVHPFEHASNQDPDCGIFINDQDT